MVTMTYREILALCGFAGIHIDKNKSVHTEDPEQLETEFTIEPISKDGVLNDGKVEKYTGNVAYFTEYPEEGCYPLGEEVEPQPLPIADKEGEA